MTPLSFEETCEAVNERIADDVTTVDWFGAFCAITNARAAEIRADLDGAK